MSDSLTDDYTCPGCNARYKRVHVTPASASTYHPSVNCLVCAQPMDASRGSQVSKYFLVHRPRKPDHGHATDMPKA